SGYRHPRCGIPLAAALRAAFAAPVPLMAGAKAAGAPVAVLPVLYHLAVAGRNWPLFPVLGVVSGLAGGRSPLLVRGPRVRAVARRATSIARTTPPPPRLPAAWWRSRRRRGRGW